MSSILDASLDDPQPAEAEARRLLAEGTLYRRALGAELRHKATVMAESAQRLHERADAMDPQPVPFDRVPIGALVLLEDQVWKVFQKETTHNIDGRVTRLIVREEGRFLAYPVTVDPDELVTVIQEAF